MVQGIVRKKSKKIEMLIKTAQELFFKHGVKKVSIEEICRKANVSKMTFYKYFSNKTDLLHHIWEGWLDEGIEKLDEIDAMDIPLPDKIQKMFEWKTNFLSNMSEELLLDIAEFRLSNERSMNRFIKFIKDAQNRGEIRADIKLEFLMTVLNKLYELGNDKELRSIYPDVMEFNREIKDFFWHS